MNEEQLKELYEANEQLYDSFEEFSRLVINAFGVTMNKLKDIYKDLYEFANKYISNNNYSKYLDNYKFYNNTRKMRPQVIGNKLGYVRCRNNLGGK